MEESDVTRATQLDVFGPRYAGATIAKLECGNGLAERLQAWMKNPKDMFVFLGTPGIGKTYLCAALVPWMMGKFGAEWRYWDERKLLQRLRDGISEGHDYTKMLTYCTDYKMLIVDDIGSSGVNDWRKEVLFEMLDQRYQSMRPTLITSNLTRAQFKNDYGERFASRLFAGCNTIEEMHTGFDLRQRAHG